jgi:hypothetical protein
MIGYYEKKPPPRPKNDWLYESCLRDATKAFDITDGGKNKPPMRHINDLKPEMFTLNTNPGYPYFQWGYTKKAEVFEMAKQRSRYICHRIKEEEPVHLPPTMIFARGSIVEKGELKLRGVWGKPLDLLIAEASIYLPWIEQMQARKIIPNGYKYTMFHRGYRMLWDELTAAAPPGQSTYIMLDFSKYDTSLPPWFLRDARKIIDDQIDFTRYEHYGKPNPVRSKRLARRLLKATIDTEFIMPDGYVFKKDTGTDSGSLMFQRDEDICTYIAGRYGIAKLGYLCQFIRVLGDDIIMAIPGKVHVDLEKLAAILLEIFGIQLNTKKSYYTHDILQASFLGRNLHFGHPKRDTVDIVFAALYPKETDRSLVDTAQRIVALMFENCYSNHAAHTFLQRCWDTLPPDIRRWCEEGLVTWDWKWRKIFRSYGLEKPPRCSPPTFDFMFWLLESPPNHFMYDARSFVQ